MGTGGSASSIAMGAVGAAPNGLEGVGLSQSGGLAASLLVEEGMVGAEGAPPPDCLGLEPFEPEGDRQFRDWKREFPFDA